MTRVDKKWVLSDTPCEAEPSEKMTEMKEVWGKWAERNYGESADTPIAPAATAPAPPSFKKPLAGGGPPTFKKSATSVLNPLAEPTKPGGPPVFKKKQTDDGPYLDHQCESLDNPYLPDIFEPIFVDGQRRLTAMGVCASVYEWMLMEMPEDKREQFPWVEVRHVLRRLHPHNLRYYSTKELNENATRLNEIRASKAAGKDTATQ